jgi:hypothetical protein
LALGAIMIFHLNFLVRFLPLVHSQFWTSAENKIQENYVNPEFGQLAALAREKIPARAKVAIFGDPNDWFSPQTFCFNLLPRSCVFAKASTNEWKGIGEIDALKSEEIEAIIFYNSDLPLPDNFKKTFEVSKNAFVAEKK